MKIFIRALLLENSEDARIITYDTLRERQVQMFELSSTADTRAGPILKTIISIQYYIYLGVSVISLEILRN